MKPYDKNNFRLKFMVFHFSYHKCITVYYQRVLNEIFDNASKYKKARNLVLSRVTGRPFGYKHFNSLLDRFYQEWPRYRAASVNNHLVDFGKLGDFRATHFVRDPRDLVVSGYHYHRRGAEIWSRITDPKPSDFAVVNGCIPPAMGPGLSFSDYLSQADEEQGLIAEMEFRRNHFEAMAAWDYDNPNCLEIRYEEIMGNEADVFERIFRHYELDDHQRSAGLTAVERHSAKNRQGKDSHIRNPASGQWRKHFTPAVEAAFNARYPDLLQKLGYDDSSS